MSEIVKLDYSLAEQSITDIRKASTSLLEGITNLKNVMTTLSDPNVWKGEDATAYIENIKKKYDFLVILNQRMDQRAEQLKAFVADKNSDEAAAAAKAAELGGE